MTAEGRAVGPLVLLLHQIDLPGGNDCHFSIQLNNIQIYYQYIFVVKHLLLTQWTHTIGSNRINSKDPLVNQYSLPVRVEHFSVPHFHRCEAYSVRYAYLLFTLITMARNFSCKNISKIKYYTLKIHINIV